MRRWNILLIAVVLALASFFIVTRRSAPEPAENVNPALPQYTAETLPRPPEPLNSWNPNPPYVVFENSPTSVEAGLDFCDQGRTKQGANNRCYSEVALGFRDPRLCEKLDPTEQMPGGDDSAEEEIYQCFDGYSRTYGLYDCSIHPAGVFRDQCYYVTAISDSIPNRTLDCSKIVHRVVKRHCTEVVERYKNPEGFLKK